MFQVRSIRTQLTLLALAAAVPLLLLVALGIGRHYEAERNDLKILASARAREVAARVDSLLSSVDSLLLVVSKTLGAGRAADGGDDDLLRSLKAEFSQYVDDIVVTPAAAVQAMSTTLSSAAGDAIVQGGIAASTRHGVLTGGSSPRLIAFRRTVMGPDGNAQAVVSVAVRLAYIQELLSLNGLPAHSILTVLDRDGVVLARSDEPQQWVGKNIRDRPVVQHILQHKDGVYENVTADGVPRLAGFATARGGWAVDVGIPTQAALAPARSTLIDGIWLALMGLAISALLAMLFAARISGPVRRLKQDTAMLVGGDLSHRSQLESPTEVGQLARAFNEMASALESRAAEREQLLTRLQLQLDRMPVEQDGRFIGIMSMAQDITERSRAEAELRESEERYRYLFESNPHPMWIHEVKTLKFLAVNQAAIESYGYAREDFDAMTIRDIHPPEELVRFDGAISKLDPTKNAAGIWRHRKKDGTTIDVEVVSHPFRFGERPARLVLANDVTERVRSQRALEESEHRYRNLFDVTPLPMWVRDEETLRFLEVNDAAVKAYDYTREEFLTMTTWDIRPPEDIERYRQVRLHRHTTGGQSRSIGRHRRRNGDVMDVEVISHPVVLNGRAARLTVVNDITERRRAEEALKDAERKYRILFEDSPDGVMLVDPATGGIIEGNQALRQMLGYAKDELSRLVIADIEAAESAAQTLAHIEKVKREGSDEFETRLRTRSGAALDVFIRVRVLFIGSKMRFMTVVRDITERKRAEEALRASEHQLRLVTDNIPAMIAYHDAGLVCRYANRRYDAFYGMAEGESVGRHQQEILGEQNYAQALPYLRRFLDGESLTYRRTHTARDGSLREIEVTGIPNCTPTADVCGFYVMIQDITARTRTERALLDSEERLRTVANNVPALIGYVDAGQRYRYVNKTFEDWYGKPAAEYYGRTMREIVGEEMYLRLQPHYEAALRGQTVTSERRTRAAGAERYARFTYVPHFADDGKVLGFYVLGYDVTEARKAEDAVRQLNVELERRVLERTAQLESANQELEAFSYSVSHDLRAPLRSIDGFSQALLEEYNDNLDDQGRDFLQRIRKASQRMAQLIDDLLGLSRVTRSEMVRSSVDLSAIARDIAAELQKSQPGREAIFAIEPGLTADADPNLMRVVLDNLLSNAWKFSARVPCAKIEFGETVWRERKVYFVRDNGAGFDMAYAERLFGAFQRLHDAKAFPGTGVGLATVQRIVRRHGGAVWGEGEVNRGAAFYFSLNSLE